MSDDGPGLTAPEANAELLQRPIVVRGNRAVLARPPERVLWLMLVTGLAFWSLSEIY
jgi:hypothetical protein